MANLLDDTWHLGQSELEMKFSAFELELWRMFHAFLRWQEDCEQCFNSYDLTANDIAVLHVIRARNNPKTLNDVARVLNRQDMYNIQYSVKKLERLELVEKLSKKTKKMTIYRATEKGIKDTEVFTVAKRSILVNLLKKEKELDIEKMTAFMTKLKFIYDEAGEIAVSYKGLTDEILKEK